MTNEHAVSLHSQVISVHNNWLISARRQLKLTPVDSFAYHWWMTCSPTILWRFTLWT